MPPSRPALHRLLPVFVAAALLALLAATPAGAQTRTVEVSGSDSRLVPNDTALVGFGVSIDRATPRAALAATSRRLRAVIARVSQAAGIERADLSTGAIAVRRVRVRNRDGEVVRTLFRASQGVRVTVRRVRRVGAVIRAGVAAGATRVSGPRFSVGAPDEVYDGALARAFDRARRKAQILAERAGLSLGEVISISERGGVSTLRGGQPAAGGANPDAVSPPINPGRSRVRATVRVVFELE